MDIVGNGVFVAAMDRPRVRRRLTLPVLAVAVVSATAVAAVAWQLARPPERVLRVDASRITVSAVSMAAFQDFIPLRGQVVPLSASCSTPSRADGSKRFWPRPASGRRRPAADPSVRSVLGTRGDRARNAGDRQINNQRSLELNFEHDENQRRQGARRTPIQHSCASAAMFRDAARSPRPASRRRRCSTNPPTNWPTSSG